jgi:hypothetical protein
MQKLFLDLLLLSTAFLIKKPGGLFCHLENMKNYFYLSKKRFKSTEFMVKITAVLDSKQTKSVGHFEENKFSVGGHQFLLECYSKLIKTYNFEQNAVNKRQFKNKNEQYCAVGLFIFKVAETFCHFFVRHCQYFLPCC